MLPIWIWNQNSNGMYTCTCISYSLELTHYLKARSQAMDMFEKDTPNSTNIVVTVGANRANPKKLMTQFYFTTSLSQTAL